MRIQLNTSIKSLAVAIAASGLLAAGAGNAFAEGEITSEDYATSGNWTVQKVLENGQFNHCRASATYENGIDFAFMATGKAWVLQFFNDNWQNREKTPLNAKIVVDGREVPAQKAFWNLKSAFFVMGDEIASVQPVMYGNVLSVVSDTGKTEFSLIGTQRAANLTQQCMEEAMRSVNAGPVTSNDAFGTPEPRREAETKTEAEPKTEIETKTAAADAKPEKLDRETTLEIAKVYLETHKIEHEILEGDDHVMKHFPINWKTKSGVIGGLMVVAKMPKSTEQVMDGFMKEQADSCKGTISQKRSVEETKAGGKAQIATFACADKESTLIVAFRVVELEPKTIAIVLEATTVSNTATSSAKPKTEMASFEM